MLHPSRTAAVLVALLAGAAAAAGLRSSASAQAPATRTLQFTELERGSTYTHVRNTKAKSPRSNAQGDLIVFTNPVADPSGRRIGKLSMSCTTTTGARNFLKSTMTCAGVVTLGDGTLAVQANVTPSIPTTTGMVTGGTGAYANARGVVVSTEGQSGSEDTVTLVD